MIGWLVKRLARSEHTPRWVKRSAWFTDAYTKAITPK